jgi:hypothetical protein
MVSHRRDLSSPQILSNGSETSKSPVGVLGRVSEQLADPIEWGSGLHSDYRLTTHRKHHAHFPPRVA